MISSSFYIPETARICDLSCEIVPVNEEVVKNVQYETLNGQENIVDTASRRSIFALTGNPNVTKIEEEDYGLCFRVRFNSPGAEMSTVYRVDRETKYVHKISHLFLKYIDPSSSQIKDICILGGTKESYMNILNYLKKDRTDTIKDLVIKVGEHWIPFINLDPEDLLPE